MDSIALLDGGTGRELRRMGAPFRQPEWSALALIEAPEFVTRVHEAYVAAGANVITTNSYAVVPFHLGTERFARDGATLASRAGQLAREVAAQAGRSIRVAGCLPPVCGSYRPDLFERRAATPILETLITALRPNVDLWLTETLSKIEEAVLVRELLGAEPRPLWVSFTLADGPDRLADPSLRSGESVVDAVRAAADLNVAALLFNCSQPEVMGSAISIAAEELQRAKRSERIALGVYANAFPPQDASAEANSTLHDLRREMTPECYLGWAAQWVRLGARIVGGCCGIGPEHIAALKREV